MMRVIASPNRARYPGPCVDSDSAAVLDQALASLGTLRYPDRWLGADGVTVQLLVSLHRQIGQRLPDAVADARDQDYSWAEIGDLLGVTRTAAWNRYGRPGRRGQPRPVQD